MKIGKDYFYYEKNLYIYRDLNNYDKKYFQHDFGMIGDGSIKILGKTFYVGDEVKLRIGEHTVRSLVVKNKNGETSLYGIYDINDIKNIVLYKSFKKLVNGDTFSDLIIKRKNYN